MGSDLLGQRCSELGGHRVRSAQRHNTFKVLRLCWRAPWEGGPSSHGEHALPQSEQREIIRSLQTENKVTVTTHTQSIIQSTSLTTAKMAKPRFHILENRMHSLKLLRFLFVRGFNTEASWQCVQANQVTRPVPDRRTKASPNKDAGEIHSLTSTQSGNPLWARKPNNPKSRLSAR